MKLFFTFFILLLFICSCSKSKSKKLTDKEKQEEASNEELSSQKEKIVLLAVIKRTSYDTLYLILKDYYVITADYLSTDSSRFYCEKAIELISEKYRIAKSKVASLIFSFKYEMLSKEEIIQSENDKAEYQEQPEPNY